MYSIRSAESWGVGDYGDLKLLLSDAATKSHADFMLINPIHATAPVPPLEPSPYLPESRRFLNVTYIRPQDIAEYAELNEADQAEVARLHAEVSPANDSIEPLDINSGLVAQAPGAAACVQRAAFRRASGRVRRVQGGRGSGSARVRRMVGGIPGMGRSVGGHMVCGDEP